VYVCVHPFLSCPAAALRSTWEHARFYSGRSSPLAPLSFATATVAARAGQAVTMAAKEGHLPASGLPIACTWRPTSRWRSRRCTRKGGSRRTMCTPCTSPSGYGACLNVIHYSTLHAHVRAHTCAHTYSGAMCAYNDPHHPHHSLLFLLLS